MSKLAMYEGGWFKLLGLNTYHKVAKPTWLNGLVIGNVYEKLIGDEGFAYSDTERKGDWTGYSWKQVEKPIRIADQHEQETFGPLSDDPLVNPKKAKGAVKAPFHATPELANIQMSNVMAGGGWKYGDYNYHISDVDAMTYLSAMRRHYLLWKDGVDTDNESGQSHLAHIMAGCAILIEAQALGKMQDNRPKTGLIAAALSKSSETFNTYCEKVEPIGNL